MPLILSQHLLSKRNLKLEPEIKVNKFRIDLPTVSCVQKCTNMCPENNITKNKDSDAWFDNEVEKIFIIKKVPRPIRYASNSKASKKKEYPRKFPRKDVANKNILRRIKRDLKEDFELKTSYMRTRRGKPEGYFISSIIDYILGYTDLRADSETIFKLGMLN